MITWPGGLAVTGDVNGRYLFSVPGADMLNFFWQPDIILPGYWSQKVTAGQVSGYSEWRFRSRVQDWLTEVEATEGLPAGLVEAVYRDVLDSGDLGHEDVARDLAARFSYGRDDPGKPPYTFGFLNDWEMTDWTFGFIYACHAVRYACVEFNGLPRRADPGRPVYLEAD